MSTTSHISTSGGLLSAAFIQNIRQPQSAQRGTKPNTFALPWRKAPKSPAALEAKIAATWETLLERWDAIARDLPLMNLSQSRERWILPFLRALDFQPLYRRSDIIFDNSEALRFNISHFGWEAEQVNNLFHAPPLHTVAPAAGLDARPAGTSAGRSPKSKSPHDMLQLFLNVSRKHRWGLLTNGLHLRLLRDYRHTYTKGYIEFDLESLFETRNFADFRALYRMAHASRFYNPRLAKQAVSLSQTSPSSTEIRDSLPLEMFYRDSQAAGVQVGADLQKQVRQAIETLGNGFLFSGGPLLAQLQGDAALCQQFYAELLHIVYRILFLLYAEQRGMVPKIGAPLDALYRQSYSLTALRAKAENNPASPEAYDLWEGLKVTFKLFRQGAADLGVYRYNGMLFAEDQTPLLDGRQSKADSQKLNAENFALRCRNRELLRAVRALTLVEREGVLQRISYADLNVEEIGGIYESLLDFSPRVTTEAETVDKREIPPNTFFLDPRGTARKTTGSYYTHPSLVNALIESALMPVLEARLAEALGSKGEENSPLLPSPAAPLQLDPDQRQAAESAILSLKICDPAMGSGHFLIAANNALARRLAQIRSGDEYPAERELRRARRDVLAHCIYGVDLNPMAVELAKVSLWINAAVDNAPLSFLDHHLKCGNSLIGAAPELLKKGVPDKAFSPVAGDDKKVAAAVRRRNKQERAGQLSLWRVTVIETLADLEQWRELNQLAEDAPRLAESRYRQYQADPAYRNAKLAADLWTAAFFWPLTSSGSGLGIRGSGKDTNLEPRTPDPDFFPTEEVFRQAQTDPDLLPVEVVDQVAELAERHKFFHWHLEFPDVFGENGEGGFDVVLGNPPWERIKLQEKEFFSDKDPAIANAANAAARRRAIAALKDTNPALFAEYHAALRAAESQSRFLRNSNRYPLTGRGDVNTYQVFAELSRNLPNNRGRAGVIVPTGIATDYTNRDFFADLVASGQLASLFDFENRRKLFPEVDSRMKFSLLTLRGTADETVSPARFAFFLQDVDDLSDPERAFTLTAADFNRLNPNTKTCPVFRTRADAELTRKLYAAAPVLVNEESGKNPWGVSFLAMFHMSGDSGLFHTRAQLEAEGFARRGNRFARGEETYLPLYEAKMFWQFDHRFGSFEGFVERGSANLKTTALQKYQTSDYSNLPWYFIPKVELKKRWFCGRFRASH